MRGFIQRAIGLLPRVMTVSQPVHGLDVVYNSNDGKVNVDSWNFFKNQIMPNTRKHSARQFVYQLTHDKTPQLIGYFDAFGNFRQLL